jgi:hypothetical protein
MASDSPWIAVGDLGSAFEKDVNVLPPSRDLAERCFDLHYEDGSIERFAFETEDRLIRSDLGKKKAPEIYRATSLQPNRYFVDFISQTDRVTTVSMFLDLEQKSFTSVTGRLPSKAEAAMSLLERSRRGRDLTGVTADFSHGAIDEPVTDATPRHRVTTNLVGHRIEYTYSPSERYEHIYVNDSFYTWHCLAGAEKGLADTDRCHYYGLGENLYLFVWREKIVPTLGVVVLSLDAMKTTGKLFGYEGNDFGRVTNFPIGAKARILNVTSHDFEGDDLE